MGITIYLGNWLGSYLDEKYHSSSGVYSKTATLVAVFLSIYIVIKQVTRSNEKE
jgi:membrane protein DedA with SNARE-associated domain